MKKTVFEGLLIIAPLLLAVACNPVDDWEQETVIRPSEQTEVVGFYLLNEGSFGGNNATLDYFDFRKGEYHKNYFAEVNPELPYELGDVGNDILIHNGFLILVMNNSNLLEIADAATCRHIATVGIPNCRCVTGAGDFIYCTSYDGNLYKVAMDGWHVEDKVKVGKEPEQVHCHDGFVYVLNSGGYSAPEYDTTISVVDVRTFEVVRTIDTGHKNLYKIMCIGDKEYVTSRGDYGADKGAVFSYNPETDENHLIVNRPVTNWCSFNGVIYTQTVTYDESWRPEVSYGKIVDDGFSISEFLDRDVVADIGSAYCLEVNPATGDFVLSDSVDGVNPGVLYYFDHAGNLLWSQVCGVNPAHIAWIVE